MITTADVLICGAGLAGVSAAYYLSLKHGVQNVILVDERPPLTLTSDKSSECYRNWWPGPGDEMVRFMNRSIDLLESLAEESDNFFGMNRRGYVFLTGREEGVDEFRRQAETISALGAGSLRVHTNDRSTYTPAAAEGYAGQPTGADLLIGSDLIREQFPFVTGAVKGMLHARRCGWLSAQQLGMYLLSNARDQGVELLEGRVSDVDIDGGRVKEVIIESKEGIKRIATGNFVNAAGPLIREVGAMLGIDLPVFNELHGKISFSDSQEAIARDAPMMIWSDPVTLPWSDKEKAELAADDDTRWMLDQFPAGAHFRPEGPGQSQILLILWTYDVKPVEPTWPLEFDPSYPEIVLRGLTRMVPALERYIGRMGRPWIDGGYYCKTRENRPLICPLPVDGAYLIGALSGFGVMASQAAGELLAAHVIGGEVPGYAPAFTLARYDDPAYQALLESWDATSGQL